MSSVLGWIAGASDGKRWKEACEIAGRARLSCVELVPQAFFPDPFKTTLQERRDFRSQIEERGLRVSGLTNLLDGYGSHGIFVGEETLAQTRRLLIEQIKLCHDLGADCVTLGSGQSRSHKGAFTQQERLAAMAEFIESLLPILDARRVTLAIDPLSAGVSDFLNTMEEAISLVELLRHSRIRLAVHTATLARGSETVVDLLDRHFPKLARVVACAIHGGVADPERAVQAALGGAIARSTRPMHVLFDLSSTAPDQHTKALNTFVSAFQG